MLTRVAREAGVAHAERVVGREALAALAADVVPTARTFNLTRWTAEAVIALAIE